MFKPALNITEQIAQELAEQIIHGDLGDNSRIQEIKLARAMSVSRGSIREALLILKRRHLIDVIPRKGALVNPMICHEVLEVIDMLAALEIRWFRQLSHSAGRSEAVANLRRIVGQLDQAARASDAVELLRAREVFYGAALKFNKKTFSIEGRE